MFAMSPLSPERPCAMRISATSTNADPSAGSRGGASVSPRPKPTTASCSRTQTEAGAPSSPGSKSPIGIATAKRRSSTITSGDRSSDGIRKERRRTEGDGDGRPPPSPVVPGAIEVPAATNSRANNSRLRRSWLRTVMRSTASSALPAAACTSAASGGPICAPDPSTSIRASVNPGKPLSASMRRMRASSASPVRCAFAQASSPMITSTALFRQPSTQVRLTLQYGVGARPRAPRTVTRSGPVASNRTSVKSQLTSGTR